MQELKTIQRNLQEIPESVLSYGSVCNTIEESATGTVIINKKTEE